MTPTLRAAADGRVPRPESVFPGTFLPRRRRQTGHVAAGVVDADDERPRLGVPDRGQRRRVGLDALELVQVQAEGVGDDRLDDVAVTAHP